MKKIITVSLLLIFNMNICYASIDKLIKKSKISQTSTISISIKDVKTQNKIYEREEKKLLHPASTLKVLSLPVCINQLGEMYEFTTKIYKDKYNNVYIKLGADPFLTTEDLELIVKAIKREVKTINKIYIDDSIIDNITYGKGWMWDDNTNPHFPPISAYNLNDNKIELNINVDNYSKKVTTATKDEGKTPIISTLKFGNKRDIKAYRSNLNTSDIIYIYGTIKTSERIYIPIINPKRNFLCNIDAKFRENLINYFASFENTKVPKNIEPFFCIKHSINPAIEKILKNSNNYYMDTIFKVASGKKYETTGTFELGQEMFREYYQKLGIEVNKENIVIEDGSGISKNNLVTADFMTSALIALEKNKVNIRNNMAQPNQGTLKNRLVELRGKLWAKTGTLSGISSICGYIEDKNGNLKAFSINIQNFTFTPSEIKNFEDEIIKIIYKNEEKKS